MKENIPWKKISRYVTGECNQEQSKEIEDWIRKDPARQDLVDDLKQIWDRSDQQLDWDTDKAWKNISVHLDDKSRKSHLRLVESPDQENKKKKNKSLSPRTVSVLFKIAATAAVAAVVMLTLAYYQPNSDSGSQKGLAMQEVETHKGQQSQFKLNDGTRVWLNAESKLKIPGTFTSDAREVFLEGEAFFKVAHDASRPFIVHTNSSLTKVLGTQFNVRAYPDEHKVQVAVKKGKVAFGADETSIDRAPKLIHNQMAVLQGNRQTVISDVKDLDNYIGWTQGKLIFKDTPLTEVLRRVERWYDIDCKLMNPELRNRTITASFQNEPMLEVLKIIALSTDMKYERKRREVIFYKKKQG